MQNTPLQNAIIELWLTSRTALAASENVPSRYDRMMYIKESLPKHFPTLVEGLTAKNIWLTIQDSITIVPV